MSLLNDPLTAAYYHTLAHDIPGNTSVSSVMSGYPPQTGGAKRKATKVVRGAKFQSRPSASYHYHTLNHPVGYQVTYRPRKGGKYILHELTVGSNGTPYWKRLEALPKTKKQLKRRSSRRTYKRRSSRRSYKRRSSRRSRRTYKRRSSRRTYKRRSSRRRRRR